jgi:hypothetical protein
LVYLDDVLALQLHTRSKHKNTLLDKKNFSFPNIQIRYDVNVMIWCPNFEHALLAASDRHLLPFTNHQNSEATLLSKKNMRPQPHPECSLQLYAWLY